MNTPKKMPLKGHRFPDSPNTTLIQTNNYFAENVFAVIDSAKSKPNNLSFENVSLSTKPNSCCAHLSEAKILKEEILLLKNTILQKDVEIEQVKIKSGDDKSHMEEFSYIASHDLKEPLRMITSYLGLLKNKFGSQLDDKANTYIDFAIDGGARLHTMFNGLLDLSQAGKINESKRSIPFNEIIEEVQINISKKIKETKAQIYVIGVMPVMAVNEKSCIKLLENLICNAIKFSKAGETPVVEISAKEKEATWEFCIADNGIGIDEKFYKQIFAVFSKLHNCSAYPGSGIGLAICKKAVEHHGGSLWVSAEVDKGSKFYFTLPK